MEQHALPLKDIHLPSTTGWWPLAPGWWFVAICCVLMIIAWYYRARLKQWLSPGTRHIALKKLDTIVKDPELGNRHQIQQISALLRQTAISRNKRAYVAGLTGSDWLTFLDGEDPHRPFSTGIGRSLIDAPYQPDNTLDDDAFDIDALVELTRRWINLNAKQPIFSRLRG
ncbi:MAG: DUF4381 domain-containing protein [Gammaproteobacteria bacterium]|nr:DUF4381 domain-containing protein [Gammaproteobacteria bacterium]